MFRPPPEWVENEENPADTALRKGLRGLPVPDISVDFNARIHAALRPQTPWWRTLLQDARPVLATAACSLAVTLVLLKGLTAATTASDRMAHPVGTPPQIAYGAPGRMEALDGNADLSAASLRGFATLRQSRQMK